MEIIFFIILFTYAMTLIILIWGFEKISQTKVIKSNANKKFSIIVVYKDENQHLPNLLKSFQALSYPLDAFEILMINDGSKVDFDFSFYNLPIQMINNVRYSQSPKKDGISLATKMAQYDWLVVTDADCIVPPTWLNSLNDFLNLNNQYHMVCGPVFVNQKLNFLHHFQAWDFVSLQAVTVGSFGLEKPFMCNGANMTFSKLIFNQINGYESNHHIASGDDVFLLQKIASRSSNSVGYLNHKDFLVLTSPLNSWKKTINQRIRWGSKSKHYESSWGIYLGLLTVLISLFYLISFFTLNYFFILLKIIIDIFFLSYMAKKTSQKQRYLLISICLYPLIILTVISKSIFVKVKWK